MMLVNVLVGCWLVASALGRPHPAQLERRQFGGPATLTAIGGGGDATATATATEAVTAVPATTTDAITMTILPIPTTTTTTEAATTTTDAPVPTATCVPGLPAPDSWLNTTFGKGVDRILQNSARVYNLDVLPAIRTCDVLSATTDAQLQRFYNLYRIAQDQVHATADDSLIAESLLRDASCDVLESIHSLSVLLHYLDQTACTTPTPQSTPDEGLNIAMWPCLEDAYYGPGSAKPFLFPQAELDTAPSSGDEVIAIAEGFGCRGNVIASMLKRRELMRRD
ncbi:hypothetical protein DFS34DRAFT_41090 [Phlyctochytrium arcticum]|nr:hypothetical protein DFS34DRAFT_41090 [Phlyctochytrium arcticum]